MLNQKFEKKQENLFHFTIQYLDVIKTAPQTYGEPAQEVCSNRRNE